MLILKIGIVASFSFMIYTNYLANAKPLGGISTGEISNKYPTLFTPSGFTFSIWGIIYLLVLVFIGYILFNDKMNIPNFTMIGQLFILSCLLNSFWLFCWHYDKIFLSTIIMILLLISLLIMLYLSNVGSIPYIVFSIYSGWISVALIANISILLYKYNVSIFMSNEFFWFFVIIGISLLIGIYMVFFENNIYYGLVFLWAYFGIIMKHTEQSKR